MARRARSLFKRPAARAASESESTSGGYARKWSGASALSGLHLRFGAVSAREQARHHDAALVQQVHRNGERALRDGIGRREQRREDEDADEHVAAILLEAVDAHDAHDHEQHHGARYLEGEPEAEEHGE